MTNAARASRAFEMPASRSTAESAAYCGVVSPSGRSTASIRGAGEELTPNAALPMVTLHLYLNQVLVAPPKRCFPNILNFY